MKRFDVAIVGLGTAGAAAAATCARAGLSVIGVDRAPLGKAGAQWCNGVPGWSFDEAGFARPEGPELHGSGGPFHLVAGWGPTTVTTTAVLDVDMRHLGSRLRQRALDDGADLRGEVTVTGFDGESLTTSSGGIQADTYVDAAGLVGVSLSPKPTVDRQNLCVAAQQVHQLDDREAAKAFFQEHGARLGEILCFGGVAGGYSILNVRVHDDRVSLLTGSIPALGQPAGTTMLRDFLGDHPWVGQRVFGGSRAIPLGLPHARIGHGRVARIGDSAGQVHAAHGSGIAQQLLAARLLADTLAAGRRPADYDLAWQRRYGGPLAGADVFRRFSQTLTVSELGRLIERRVLSPAMMADTLTQRPVRPPVRALAGAARGLAKIPGLAARVTPVLARMKTLEAHYRLTPSAHGSRLRWLGHRNRLAGISRDYDRESLTAHGRTSRST